MTAQQSVEYGLIDSVIEKELEFLNFYLYLIQID